MAVNRGTHTANGSRDVDLVVNVWERTAREVLQPAWFQRLEDSLRHQFSHKILLINNLGREEYRLRELWNLSGAGQVDEVVSVADRLPSVLDIVGLSASDLEPLSHYSDCALVGCCVPRSPWFLYWDPFCEVVKEDEWILPAVYAMEASPEYLVANPSWWGFDAADRVASTAESRDWYVSYGFSDTVFLARRDDFAKPIYREWHLASLRYPFAHIGPIFEQRVDSYMRTTFRKRLTHKHSMYRHRPEEMGASHPRRISAMRRARRRMNMSIVAGLKAIRWVLPKEWWC